MKLGESVKNLRKEIGLSQKDLAKRIGVTQTYLSLIESGKKVPSVPVLESIAGLFKSPLPVLLWFSVEITDVPIEKREAYKMLKPSIDQMIKSVFLD